MTKTVLIVDDCDSTRIIVCTVLHRAKFKVIEAINGKEGLAKINSKIDLIITSLNMPGMGGFEMVREITPCLTIPIIMLSVESNYDMKVKGKSIGINTWMVKPFEPDKLIYAVNELL